jgi:hypothetical protein
MARQGVGDESAAATAEASDLIEPNAEVELDADDAHGSNVRRWRAQDCLTWQRRDGSGATAASSYHFMMPPHGMLFGWLLLGEHVTLTDLVGIVPVAIGICLVTRSASSRSRT